MMWDNIIDFISNHLGDGSGYMGEGIFKTSTLANYQAKGKLGEIIEECINKYGAHDIMIFASIGPSCFNGPHQDEQDVLIRCLCGQITYSLYGNEEKLNEPTNTVTLSAGETLLVPKGKWHGPSSLKPRAVLSMAVGRMLGTEEVTYHWDNLV